MPGIIDFSACHHLMLDDGVGRKGSGTCFEFLVREGHAGNRSFLA
jgi:hypothetical protein